MSKIIRIKTNLLTIGIVAAVAVIVFVLYLTNGIQNLFFACITPNQIESVTVYEQSLDQRSAQLTEEDILKLAPLLQKVMLQGDSVRLLIADRNPPQYRVKLKSGIAFDLFCHGNYYIINGRAYPVGELSQANFSAIDDLYNEHIRNREYFPREGGGDGA